MRRVIWSDEARGDLGAIDAFLMSLRPSAAVQTLEAIDKKARLLERFPAAGPVLVDEVRATSIVGTPYSLIYQVVLDEVRILRIRHEREDWR